MEEINNKFNKERQINEAKKFSLNYKIQAANQLLLERGRFLTIISSIAFAFVGISISANPQFFQNLKLAYFVFIFLILLALFSLYKYL
jgi:hypothetical protein